jgi:glycerol-3-phosphate dehydrogenase (NAD(P)+)
MPLRIAVFGAGAWGTAMAQQAALKHSVLLVARSAPHADLIQRERRNRQYLPEIELRPAIEASDDHWRALDWLKRSAKPLAVLASPMSGLPALAALFQSEPQIPVLWLSKGLLFDSAAPCGVLLPHEKIRALLPQSRFAPLLGPSFALEVAQGLPVALTVATADDSLSALTVEAFHCGAMRIYRNDDIIGVELGAALKNVVAIATGISDGLELGLNARAALITRGLAETSRLGIAMGGRAQTFMGLTGLGDLVLTTTGALSRNRRVGLELARGQTLSNILASLGHVAEGVATVEAALRLGEHNQVELPICAAVGAVLRGELAAADAARLLLAREPKHESQGASGR